MDSPTHELPLCSALAFMPSTGSQGFQIPYPAITLHAISRTETGPSIYCQLDDQYDPAKVNGTDEAEDDEAGEIRELTIVPSDSTLRKSCLIMGAARADGI
jgi:nucleotide-sensitive chloride channel 1A